MTMKIIFMHIPLKLSLLCIALLLVGLPLASKAQQEAAVKKTTSALPVTSAPVVIKPATTPVKTSTAVPLSAAPTIHTITPATPTTTVTAASAPLEPKEQRVKPVAPITPPVTSTPPAVHPQAAKPPVQPVSKVLDETAKKHQAKEKAAEVHPAGQTLAQAVVAPVVRKEPVHQEPKEKKEKPSPPAILPPLPPDMIDFTFDNADLTEVIERYARKRRINIILPQQAQAIKQKITFKPPHPLTLDEAQKYLYLFLDYAGYTVSPRAEFELVIKTKEAATNVLPLYVFNTATRLKAEELPQNDAYIRVVYYLANMKIDDQSNNPVLVLLRETLSAPNNVFVDPLSNAIIVTDKARLVTGALQILRELDSATSKHILITLQLYNANAGYVADLLNTQILAVSGKNRPLSPDVRAAGVGTYFSTNIRVVADPRRNTLIIMGKEAPVNRLKDFVREYMDAPAGTGKSIFHVYDLKYLDAQSFADVLSSVVRATGIGEQKSVERAGGARRFFEGVVIRAETYQPVAAAAEIPSAGGGNEFEQGTSSATVYRGGNRLLVAAQPSDWEQIKKLVDQLDIPQKQVILEVLIIDFTRDEIKAIQNQIRNPIRTDFLPGAGVQAANITSNVLTSVTCGTATAAANAAQTAATVAEGAAQAAAGTMTAANVAQGAAQTIAGQGTSIVNNALSGSAPVKAGVQAAAAAAKAALAQQPNCPVGTTITGDLLRFFTNSAGATTTIIPSDPGTFAVSFNDSGNNGVWDLLAILDQYGHTRIIAHPYLIALDNTNAVVYNTDVRRAAADTSSSTGGAIEVNIADIQATLSVSLTPRISSIERLNLEIKVKTETFTDTTGFTRASRYVQTNVNMRGANDKDPKGEILVLGGLKQATKTQSVTETPILGRIPILGWLFRGVRQTIEETELGIFIKPTIIDPRRRVLMNQYTREKVKCETSPIDYDILGNRKDPIVRFFFGSDERAEHEVIEAYMRENYIVPPPAVPPPPPPSSHEHPLEPLERFESALMSVNQEPPPGPNVPFP